MGERKAMMTEKEAIDKLRELGNRVFGKRWMVAVWEVEEQKDGVNALNLAGRVSWKFPTGDFEKCLEMLKKNMEEETNAAIPPAPEPLKVADWLAPPEEKKDVTCGCEDVGGPDEKEMDELFNPPKEGGE